MPDLDTIRATLARIPNPLVMLESLFGMAPIGLQIYESSGTSILVNQAFLDLFGSEPPPGYNVLRDEIAERTGVLALIHRAFAGETVTVPPIWYDPRDITQVRIEKGNRVAMSATFFPLVDRHGRVSHVAVAFRDMTAEMLAQEHLEQERELLSAVIEQSADGVIYCDEAGVVRIVNEAARRLGTPVVGVPAARWLEEYGLEREDGSLLPLEQLPAWQALQGQQSSSIVYVRTAQGRRALSASAVPLRRKDGSIRGAVVTLRDETERLQREQDLARTAHFRERFIGILGHDLRSPLTAISASAALILKHQGLPPTVNAAGQRVASAAQRMGRMISDLLDFTQARLGGGLSIAPRACDLGEVVRAAVDEVLAANPGRAVSLAVEGDASGSFDPDRIAQLATNLLQNALAYSPPGSPIAATLHGEGNRVRLSVHNAGAAIPAAEQATLFDPFRRGSQRGPDARGLGLGLFIVQQIAEAHGGSVGVHSGADGTTFSASLPRQR